MTDPARAQQAMNQQHMAQIDGVRDAEDELLPTQLDVIGGRGKGCQEHIGNKRRMMIALPYKPQYQRQGATKRDKAKIKLQVYRQVKYMYHEEYGIVVRFLHFDKDTGRYSEMDEDAALKSIRDVLRDTAERAITLEQAAYIDSVVATTLEEARMDPFRFRFDAHEEPDNAAAAPPAPPQQQQEEEAPTQTEDHYHLPDDLDVLVEMRDFLQDCGFDVGT